MRLVNADAIIKFPFSESSGTEEQIMEWIEEHGLADINMYLTDDCRINAEDAIYELCYTVIRGMINVVESAPTIEPYIKKAKWIKDSGGEVMCSNCFETAFSYVDHMTYRDMYYHSNYCPNCGAKITKEDGNE